MTLTLDYLGDGRVARWMLTRDGVAREVHDDYRPTLFVGDAPDDLYRRAGGPELSPPSRDGLSDALTELRSFLDGQQAVSGLGVESHRQTFRTEARPLLRVDATSIEAVRMIAKLVRQFDQPDTFTCYNVDFTRQLRFCLETDTLAAPDREVRDLRTLQIEFPSHESGIESLPQLTVDGERVGSSPRSCPRTPPRSPRSTPTWNRSTDFYLDILLRLKTEEPQRWVFQVLISSQR